MATGLFNLKQVNQAISQGAWSGYIAPKWVEYLVVAGGGGGASEGGGGAGGLLTGIVTVAAGASYSVTIGGGGAAATAGVNSVFGSISATGGGNARNNNTGVSGGSGGGGAASSPIGVGGQGVAGQGNAGGGGANATFNAAGGGGGAGTVGLSAVTGNIGGNGGAGIASAITGSVVTYAGGGGGAMSGGVYGAGGVGGGGAAGAANAGTAGGGNTGGGGGGTWGATAAAGGSGIVVVRYPGSVQFFTGGTLSYANGYIIHTFYANGTLAPTAPTPYVTDYQISRSLRFNSADSAYLNRTPASAGNKQTWTLSIWVKRAGLSAFMPIYSAGPVSPRAWILLNSSDKLDYRGVDSTNTEVIRLTTTQVFRDPSAWYHIVVAQDTTQATSSNRVKIYVNGTQITAFDTATYPSQNASNLAINDALEQNYGRYVNSPSDGYLSAYLTETNFIDGQALTPSSFGYTDPDTGVWSPLAFVGTYGTNGFYLNFSDNSNTTAATLGKDYSGNGNNWTPNGFLVSAGVNNDSLVDSPTSYGTDTGVGGTVRGNYGTWNAVDKSASITPSNGNLQLLSAAGSWYSIRGTIGVSSGKWYWECEKNGSNMLVGIGTSLANINSYPGSDTNGYGYNQDGTKIYNGSSSSYGATFTDGDIIGVALDLDAGTLVFYKNGTSQGTAFTGISGIFMPMLGVANGVTAYGNFGQRPFAYTAPSGFKALCTQNLP